MPWYVSIDRCWRGQPEAAPAEDKHFSSAEATGIIATARKIVSGKGVEELQKIPIGGTQQWISVRGRDRANPILLMIHGGTAAGGRHRRSGSH
jgi:hypothetical protein